MKAAQDTQNISNEARERLHNISKMEMDLINGNGSFFEMMAETRKFLTITKPIKHKHNFNNNQII